MKYVLYCIVSCQYLKNLGVDREQDRVPGFVVWFEFPIYDNSGLETNFLAR